MGDHNQAEEAQAGPAPRRLVAVVVTHNRLAQLRETVARLLASPAEELAALVVVDNLSGDGTGAWLAGQTDPRLEVLTARANLGGAGGFEWGMRQAVARHDPDWLVLMDDDGRPQPGALAAFQAADLAGWDAVAAAVYYPDGAICEMNRPSRNPFWNLRGFFTTLLRLGRRDSFHIRPEIYAGAVPVAVDITSFVGFFVSRQMVERVGFPDGALFVYGDDGLYSLGLRLAGGRIGFFPQIRFEHDCSTFAQSAGRFRPLWKAYYYHRNLFLLYRRAAGGFFWLVLVLALPKWLLKVRHHPGERRAYLRLLGKAVSDGFRGRTGVPHDAVMAWAEGPS